MRVRLVIFPSDDGLNAVVWGRWVQGSMRSRHFETRSMLIGTLLALRLIDQQDAVTLEKCIFEDSCPLFSGEIEEELLADHGFELA